MLQHGSPRWIMMVFGLLTAVLGLYLWNRQGEHFGLGNANGKVSRNAVIISASLLIVIAVTEFIINSK
jgi:hypothetical protein